MVVNDRFHYILLSWEVNVLITAKLFFFSVSYFKMSYKNLYLIGDLEAKHTIQGDVNKRSETKRFTLSLCNIYAEWFNSGQL